MLAPRRPLRELEKKKTASRKAFSIDSKRALMPVEAARFTNRCMPP
jgi:hypothetical protein